MKPWTEARNDKKYMKSHCKLTYQLILKCEPKSRLSCRGQEVHPRPHMPQGESVAKPETYVKRCFCSFEHLYVFVWIHPLPHIARTDCDTRIWYGYIFFIIAPLWLGALGHGRIVLQLNKQSTRLWLTQWRCNDYLKTNKCLVKEDSGYVNWSKETLRLRVTGLCEGNPPVTDRFPSQRASNAERYAGR